MKRCGWAEASELMIAYHDREWGVPIHDDRKLFEYLVLDTFQAGLSWAIILHKRENFRQALANFDPEKIARYMRRDIGRLLANPGIVRNKQKIAAVVTNARAFLRIQEGFGSFDAFVWQFVGGKSRHNSWRTMRQLPAKTRESDRMSEAMRDRGFTFTGSTICYAFMQAAGMVNDHLVSCFRHAEIRAL
ncbi:MAG: DNA-3-methyladenine glycosylase I, partial [candidate division NC10 bacterium]|nr:DNA-3-methyladenine glycosylase I [candidate division NC10 bacterium]